MAIRQRLKYCFDMKHSSKLRYIIILGLILVTALALRMYSLDRYSFWYDEAIAVLDARRVDQLFPLSKLFDGNFLLNHHDYLMLYTHGFVYYWKMLFGESEFALRLSSVIFSLLSIYALYVLAKDFFDIKIARLTAFLIAISPFHIYYSQELRPYAAICLFTLISAYSFLKVITGGSKKYWLAYISFSVLSVYFQYMNLMVLLSFCIFFIFRIKKYKHLLMSFLLSHGVIIILLIPVFLTLYPNLEFVLHNKIPSEMSDFPIWRAEINIKSLIYTLKNFSIGYNIDYHSLAGKCATLTCLFLFLSGALWSFRKIGMKLLLTCLFTPLLTMFFISKIKSCYVDRYFFSVFPFYLLGAAIGLSRMNKKTVFIFVLAITAFNYLALRNYNLNYLPDEYAQHVGVVERQNIKGFDKFISDNYKIGDRIIHTCRNTVFPLKFYIRQTSPNADLIQKIDRGTVIVFNPDVFKEKELFRIDYKGLHPTIFLPEEFKIAKDLEKNHRLWIVFSSWRFKGIDSQEYEVIKRIKENFKEDRLEEFDGAFVYLFSKN
ncbi:MAG: glycosyltransferase family 39 protein [Candidatus Omnitrophica bacterium]|nr:glycosyltransferase family 39 protein [Candidatus Omnitrophota bacterium]